VRSREEFSRQGHAYADFQERNKHIQQVLVEAAKLAPRYSHELSLIYEKEMQRGNNHAGNPD